MRIVVSYRGTESTWEVLEDNFVLGRAHENSPIQLDLSPDKKIPRVHARLWREDGTYWIQDHQSLHGTLLSNVEIKGERKQESRPDHYLGHTTASEVPGIPRLVFPNQLS